MSMERDAELQKALDGGSKQAAAAHLGHCLVAVEAAFRVHLRVLCELGHEVACLWGMVP
jgi:hypothetical protein